MVQITKRKCPQQLFNTYTSKVYFGGAVGTNFLESYLEEYLAGIYFCEFNQNGRNNESTAKSVLLK